MSCHWPSVLFNFQYLFLSVMVPFISSFIFQDLTETAFGHYVVLPSTSSTYYCVFFNPINSTLWLAYYLTAINFLSHFQSFLRFWLRHVSAPMYGSAILAWYYSAHLLATLILPTSSFSWLISSGTSPPHYSVLSLAFYTTVLSVS